METTAPTIVTTTPTQLERLRTSVRRRTKRTLYRLNDTYIYSLFPLLHLLVLLAEMAAIAHIVSRYNSYFDKRPVLTMMITNSILNGIADTTAQTVTSVRRQAALAPTTDEGPKTSKLGQEIELLDRTLDEKLPHYGRELVPTDASRHVAIPPPFDFERLVRFMGWGLIVAPFQFKWLSLLSRTFPITATSAMGPVLKRVACDQFVFAPTSLVAFFSYMTVAEGGDAAAVKKRLGQVFAPTLKANYMLWPAVQLLNFRVMPLQFQLPFSSTVGIAWGTYLSLANSASEP